MPELDKTGPLGQGAQTGRKTGRCRTENETLTDEIPFGRGRGLGRGIGRWLRLGNEENLPGQGQRFFRRRRGKN